jgi:uncharacterized membrane protein YjjP (DUF1212 family)
LIGKRHPQTMSLGNQQHEHELITCEEPPAINFSNETELEEAPLKYQQHDHESNTSDVLETLHTSVKLDILLNIGRSAIQYGSAGIRVEEYLRSQSVANLQCSSDNVYFSVSNSEIIACIHSWEEENGAASNSMTVIVGVKEGMHLQKLARLTSLARDVASKEIALHQVTDELKCIHELINPYNKLMELFGWMAVGTGLPIVLGGSWWDSLLSSIGGTVAFGVTELTARYASQYSNSWGLGLSSFLPAILITGVRLVRGDINVVISVLSSVAISLPGYTVSLGLAELAANRIVRGAGHMISGLVTLLWLVLGGYLGESLVTAISEKDPPQDLNAAAGHLWLVLFIPLIAVALNIAFQIAYSDFLPAMTVSILSYAVSFGANYLAESNTSTFISAMMCTIAANIWCMVSDRSQPIVLTPAIVFLVSGSIGFRGVAEIFAGGDAQEGMEQFIQMFVVAMVISLGVLAGNTLVFPKTTL